MSVMRGWSICDRCSFKYRRGQLRKEATGFVVCRACDDGAYDLIRHPQNRPPLPRREMLPIPDGRPQDQPWVWGLTTEDSDYITTEDGLIIEVFNYNLPMSAEAYAFLIESGDLFILESGAYLSVLDNP